jgi:16S rRNA (uracil1498-N3)-methyltransferase
VALPEHTGHHARDVLRLRPGAEVRVFDGAGHEFAGVLETVARGGVTCHVSGAVETRPESPLRIVLAMAALKGDRMELVIQKATELGVAAIQPIVTARTDAAARPALKGARHDRWEKVAGGAAEQCGRAVVPEVAPTVTLRDLLAAPFAGARIAFVETEDARPLADAPRADSVQLLVGPAGGWEPSEVAAFPAAGVYPASLGPRILRAETAALAAVTALQVLWGDLR